MHVDLVKNEWLAGFQHVVARLRVENGAVLVDASKPIYKQVALRPFLDYETREPVSPERDPDRAGLHAA